jgi:hypothetical protein
MNALCCFCCAQGAYNAQLAKTAELEARLLQKNVQLAQLNAQLVGMAQALGLIPVSIPAVEYSSWPTLCCAAWHIKRHALHPAGVTACD